MQEQQCYILFRKIHSIFLLVIWCHFISTIWEDMEPGSQLQGRHWIRLKKHLYWGNGKILLSTLQHLSDSFEGQWGKLSVLGELEQKGIAGRMMRHYPQLFSNSAKVEAIATYVPRCINSMDAFLTRLMQDNPSLRIQRNEGRQYDDILRFFDLNKSYVNYKNNGDWLSIYKAFVRNKISSASIMKKFIIEPERPMKKRKRLLWLCFP